MSAIPEDCIYTMEDIKALPEGQRAELVDGRMYTMVPPNLRHELINFEMSLLLATHLKEIGSTCVFTSIECWGLYPK